LETVDHQDGFSVKEKKKLFFSSLVCLFILFRFLVAVENEIRGKEKVFLKLEFKVDRLKRKKIIRKNRQRKKK
jgi:hypothetical protein